MIDVDRLAKKIRARLFKSSTREYYIANLRGSLEEKDQYTLVNCNGFGRRRKLKDFRLHLENPITNPDRPAVNFRTVAGVNELETQVFQIAGCNLRCWYCYVDDNRLSGRGGAYMTANEMVDLYLGEENRSPVLDLSGGEPSLVPEWLYDTLVALEQREQREKVHVWIDDNLTSFNYWTYLTKKERQFISDTPNHCRAVCFKGFDQESFQFTTLAKADFFERQFQVAQRYVDEAIKLYGYVTFTTDQSSNHSDVIERFVDRLQCVSEDLPLRVIPLRIVKFHAMRPRLLNERADALRIQEEVFEIWNSTLQTRFGKVSKLRRRNL